MKKVVLLDGYNLMYRARYSGMNKGEYSTIFNFFRGLRPLIEKFNPDLAYFVLEGAPKKRLAVAPDYKGQRVYNNDDNFSAQRKIIIKLLQEFFPIQLVKHNDFECDDVIGYLAEKHKVNDKVTIISSDTDFIQCIDNNVELYNPVRKLTIEKPDHDYVLWKSLKGDASDNIEGFKGIGDKKALMLCNNPEKLQKFLNEDTSRMTKLEHNKFMIKLHDLTSETNNIQYYNTVSNKNWDDLRSTFEEYSFKSMTTKDTSWNKYIKTFDNLFERYIQ